MNRDILVRLLIAGNGFALLAFGIGQLLVKGKRAVNYWSFAFFSYAAASFLFTAMVNSGPLAGSLLLVWMDFPIISLIGPLFFFYFSRLADPDYRVAWKDQWLFIPPALFAIASPMIHPKGGVASYRIASLASSLAVLWVVSCIALFLARAIRRAKEDRRGESRRLRFLIAISGGLIAWAVVFFACSLLDFGILPQVLTATLLIMALYFYHLRHPELLAPSQAADAPERRQPHGRSKVARLDVEAIIARLTRTMDEDRPYLRDDLSLPDLAARIDLSPHQLSEILNREMSTTFKAYINGHRVREARRVLRERPDATVIEVALDCGFRSKSAFNDIFREETGTTPTEYRRRAESGGGGGG